MEPAFVNIFLDQFIAVADTGFGLIQGDVNFVLNALIAISITLAGVQWALIGEAPMAPFFRKVLFVGLFAFLVNNWDGLVTAINQSGAMLGLKAGGGGLTLADLHNPGRVAGIGTELFGKTVALSDGMNILIDFVPLVTIYIAAVFVALGFFILALQIFVSLIAFKLGSLAAFVALPWGIFSGTAWIAERPLGWVAGCAIRLFILGLIASISLAFVETLPETFTLDEGGALNVLLFGLTILALAWFAPQLANDVMQGQPHLSGGDAWRAGTGAAMTTIGAGAAGYYGGKSILQVGRALSGGAARAINNVRRGGSSPSSGGGVPPPRINYGAMQAPKNPPSSKDNPEKKS